MFHVSRRPLLPLSAHVHETHCCAVTLKPYNYKGDCAYVNGLPDWAEDDDVVVLKIFFVSICCNYTLFIALFVPLTK